MPTDATDKRITWTSSKKAVATVDAYGIVSAVKVGTSTITATSADTIGGKNISASCVVTVGTTGVDDVESNDFVSIYPNPAKNELFVKPTEVLGDGCINARLYDSFSNMVMNIKNDYVKGSGILSIDTSMLPNGVYILQITNGNKVCTRKVIISK
jgi:hypothetical protein